MNRCEYINQETIKLAFINAVSKNKVRITQSKLIDNVVKNLGITKEQLKSTYITAFLVCYMKELDWMYNKDQDTFIKVDLNETAKQLLIAMKASGYTQHQIDDIKLLIVSIFYGRITSCNVYTDSISLTNKDKNRHLEFKRSEL